MPREGGASSIRSACEETHTLRDRPWSILDRPVKGSPSPGDDARDTRACSGQNRMTAGNSASSATDTRPILIIPYMWIGDFVRCHSAVKLLNARWPLRPIDLLTTNLCAPLIDYMPG